MQCKGGAYDIGADQGRTPKAVGAEDLADQALYLRQGDVPRAIPMLERAMSLCQD
ncbi:MAG TPA: hypothetical protein VIH59_21605 [Candidatus Tectomicrobia bacterium]